jgi:hypothetical protein
MIFYFKITKNIQFCTRIFKKRKFYASSFFFFFMAQNKEPTFARVKIHAEGATSGEALCVGLRSDMS